MLLRAGAAAPAGRGRGRRGKAGGAGLTGSQPEERAAAIERARQALPPEPLIFAIDGKTVACDIVEGDGNFDYAHGENVLRAKLSAGDHPCASPIRKWLILRTRARMSIRISAMSCTSVTSTSSGRSTRRRRRRRASRGFSSAASRVNTRRHARGNHREPASRAPTVGRRRCRKCSGCANLAATCGSATRSRTVIRVVIAAVLMSPHFLFRIEADLPSQCGRRGRRKRGAYLVSDYELASRLSYFLWSCMPDDELLQAAGAGRLRQPAVLDAQVHADAARSEIAGARRQFRRAVAEPAADGSQEAGCGEVHLRRRRTARCHAAGNAALRRRGRAAKTAASWTSSMAASRSSTARWRATTASRASTASSSSASSSTASERSGIVTQGSILTISSYATRTSPVLRGKWVLDNLLGAPPPPPPDDIPPLQENDLGTAASMRAAAGAAPRRTRLCRCHDPMDPIGFAPRELRCGWRLAARRTATSTSIPSARCADGRTFTGR